MSGGLMLDAGALIAIDRGDRRMLALLEEARRARLPISVTAPVVGQAWRDGGTQARLASFLKQSTVDVTPFGVTDGRAVGELATMCGHTDVVDVHVVLIAMQRAQTVVTSDPLDIRKVSSRIPIVAL
jgi:hypothetical protein